MKFLKNKIVSIPIGTIIFIMLLGISSRLAGILFVFGPLGLEIYLYTKSEKFKLMFNANLLINGYAEQSAYPPDVKYAEYFKRYASEARNAGKGLWAISPNGITKGNKHYK